MSSVSFLDHVGSATRTLSTVSPLLRRPLPTRQDEVVGVTRESEEKTATRGADSLSPRFEFSDKEVNPNLAINLIAEIPPIPSGRSFPHCLPDVDVAQ